MPTEATGDGSALDGQASVAGQGVSRLTLYKMLDDRAFPAAPIRLPNGDPRWPQEVIDEWVDSRRCNGDRSHRRGDSGSADAVGWLVTLPGPPDPDVAAARPAAAVSAPPPHPARTRPVAGRRRASRAATSRRPPSMRSRRWGEPASKELRELAGQRRVVQPAAIELGVDPGQGARAGAARVRAQRGLGKPGPLPVDAASACRMPARRIPGSLTSTRMRAISVTVATSGRLRPVLAGRPPAAGYSRRRVGRASP